jgi:hypothetical protein
MMQTMSTIVDATVVEGFKAASNNLKFQLPHLIWQFPEIEKIHPGTINVKLDSALEIENTDFTTPVLPWWDNGRGGWVAEVFSFLRIGFEYPLNSEPHNAWFYISHGSAHRLNPFVFRVITEHISSIAYQARCRVHVNKATRKTDLIVV